MSILERRPPALKRTLHASPASAVEPHASVQNRCGGEGCLVSLSVDRMSCVVNSLDR